jgi:hypothetical protein
VRKLILAAAALGIASAAGAQTPREVADAELRAFVARYVDAFNKGDAALLAREFYRPDDVSVAEVEAKLAKQFAALRADSFGRMTLYSANTCVHGAAAADVQISFAYNYTFGGVMDPGDQAAVFYMRKTNDGWRITKSDDLKPDQGIICAL